jgi:SPX domain protein involved in polyphosphate accumulation
MSTLSQTIRHFNRFELKYLITLKQAEEIRKTLLDYLKPDEHSNREGHYSITSLYYDSPDYRCYWEKMDGVRYRRKLRIRNYDSTEIVTENTPVFVEIKQRFDRVTQKRRIILPYRDAIALCNLRQTPGEIRLEDKQVVQEIESFTWQYNLSPVSIVHYQRQAYVGGDFDIGLRVTFDTKMVSQSYPLAIFDLSQTTPMFKSDEVIMEIKANERIPYWVTEMVASYNLRMVRISKYCRSIDHSNVFPSFSVNYLHSEI